MDTIRTEILKHLSPLVGLKLSLARRAADLRGFHFGQVTFESDGKRSFGEFVFHIQCAWRIEGPDGIVTGSADLWVPVNPHEEFDWHTWNYDENENLQDQQIESLLGSLDLKTKSFINNHETLFVESVDADQFGGATISLTGGYRIVIFPNGSSLEDWRFFKPSSETDQLIVCGGQIQE